MTILNDEPWAEHALCAQVDPELWFPAKGNPGTEAKAVCAKCPVRQECLDYAIANREQEGVWGGMTLRERREHNRRLTGDGRTRTHCDKGHDFERVGRRGDGRCAECALKWERARRREGAA